MWLPMKYTLTRHASYTALAEGRYQNIRLFNYGFARVGDAPWSQTPAWTTGPIGPWDQLVWARPTNETVDAFASTCWYYGEALVDILGEPDLPLGLLLSSVGGTTIEEWARAKPLSHCQGAHKNATDYNLFNTMVAPLVNTSVSTLLWYQGENDLGVGTLPGSVSNRSGYACALARTIADWRTLRAEPQLPVGIFGLAPGGSEGHPEQMAAFRAAQTTGFGTLPSHYLPNSFFVPIHDLGDPCNKHSKSAACIGNGIYSYKCLKNQTCANVTPFRDSRIHSRVKRLVGARAAHAAAALVYKVRRPSTGPVVAGCSLNRRSGSIVVHFDISAGMDSNASTGWNFVLQTPFLTNESYKWSAFEVQLPSKSGKAAAWLPVNASKLSPSSVILSSMTEPVYAATAVRYAWSEQPCCAAVKGEKDNGNCAPGSCPLWTVATGASSNNMLLPALPFAAAIVDGKCHCVLPQSCSGSTHDAGPHTLRDHHHHKVASPPLSPSQLLCELRREPMGVSRTSLLFTWSYPPSDVDIAAFQVTIMSSLTVASADIVWTSGKIVSRAAAYQFEHPAILQGAMRYFWTVTAFYANGVKSVSATPQKFATAVDNWRPTSIWLVDNTPDEQVGSTVQGKPAVIKQPTLAHFRKTVQIGSGLDSALLFIAAKRTHKQLGSYKLFVNGRAAGIGPGRSPINAELKDVTSAYDSFDLTEPCHQLNGVLTLGVSCFAAEQDGQLIAALQLNYKNGTRLSIGTDPTWRARNATASFGPIGTAGTQYYTQPHEFLDARLFVGGNVDEWALPGFDDSSWGQSHAIVLQGSYYFSAPLAPKPTLPLQLMVGDVEITEELGPGHWTFRAPKEIQGGVRLRVTGAQAGTTVVVRLGEETYPNSTLPMYKMRTGNLYQSIWTLDNGTNELQAHEYVEFSRGEIIMQPPRAHLCAQTTMSGDKLIPGYIQCPTSDGIVQNVTFAAYGQPMGSCNQTDGSNTFRQNSSCTVSVIAAFEALCIGQHRCEIKPPENSHEPCHGPKSVAVAVICNDTNSTINEAIGPSRWLPSSINVSTWIVRYPFNETDSSFTSNSAALNAVFALSKYTIKSTNLDMWTDSNTRQRDVNCNEANGVVPLMQSAVALEFMSQRWTSQYILDSRHAERSFAEWRPISVSYVTNDVMATGNLSQAIRYYNLLVEGNYTLEPWLDRAVGLVNVSSLPAPEIDWPSNMRDCYASSDYSTIVNAYVVRANMQMAQIADWLGKHDEATAFNETAAMIRAALNRHNWDEQRAQFCDGVCAPQSLLAHKPPNTADSAWTNHSAWHSQVFMLAFNLVDGEKAREATFQSVRSRLFGVGSTPAKCAQSPSAHPQGKWPAPEDGMPGNVYSAYFALQALYNFKPDRGAAALALLTSDRRNTWLAMIKSGATTTKEAWTEEEKPNLTWSHPWGASPAVAIPRWLLGVTATQPGFARVRIQPQLGGLVEAAGKVPTLRGPIELSVARPHPTEEPLQMVVRARLPGGVLADVWLPVNGTARTAASTLCVNGVAMPATDHGYALSVSDLKGIVTVSVVCA